MPKKIKGFPNYHSRGSSGPYENTQTDTNYYYNELGEYLPETKLEAGYTRGVQPSNADKILDKLISFIENNKLQELKDLLGRNFIYPGLKNESVPPSCANGEFNYYKYDYYEAAPILETLFNEHKDKFTTLVNLLCEKNDAQLSQAFIDALVACNLDSLLQWNGRIKTKLLDEIRTLLNYDYNYPIEFYKDDFDEVSCWASDKKLASGTNEYYVEFDKISRNTLAEIATREADQHSLKHSKMVTLAQELTSKVQDKRDNTAMPHSQAQLMNLQFKLQMSKSLHKNDQLFATHRGYKRCIVNILSVLFTGGLANVINKFLTGNFLFFNQTTSQEKIANVQDAISTEQSATFRNI